jgi:hypothetical protein
MFEICSALLVSQAHAITRAIAEPTLHVGAHANAESDLVTAKRGVLIDPSRGAVVEPDRFAFQGSYNCGDHPKVQRG